jgi:ribonuclease P protein component
MLPAKNRLIKKEDFSKAYQKGEVFSGDNIAIKIARNEISQTRLGFSVGKKFLPKAILRNKGKRILREAFGQYSGKIKTGFDIIVIYKKKQLINEENGLLKAKKEAKELLRKAKLLKN